MEDELETGKPEPKPTKTGRETFSAEYVAELRAENKSYRLKASEAERKLQEEVAKTATLKTEADASVAEAKKTAQAQVAVAKVEALAVKAGIVDLDALALVDQSQFVFDDAGKITNAAEVLEAFKTAKPHFFGSTNTSDTQPAPKPAKDVAKDAMQMSPEELKADLARHGVNL